MTKEPSEELLNSVLQQIKENPGKKAAGENEKSATPNAPLD